MSKILLTNEIAVPPTPSASTVTLFAQGNALYSKNGLGVVTALGGGVSSVTINTAAPLAGGATGALFNLTFSTVGQATGDLLRFTGGAWSSLPIGTANQVLTIVGGTPTWATPTASSYTYVPLSGRYVTDSTQPAATTEPAGGNTWHPAEHNFTGARTIRLRAVFGSVVTPTAVQIALFSIFNSAYVTNLDGGGNPYIQTTLVAGSLAAMVPLLSRDLRATPLSNFDESVDGRLYEVHVRSMVGGVAALLHVAELVVGLP